MNDQVELVYCCDLLESVWLEACEKFGFAEDLGRLGVRFVQTRTLISIFLNMLALMGHITAPLFVGTASMHFAMRTV